MRPTHAIRRFVGLSGATTLFALAAFATPQAAFAQEATSICSDNSNRFVRFFGASYVARNQFCGVQSQLQAQKDLAMAAEERAAAAAGERDLALTRISDLEAQLDAAGACSADQLQSALDMSRSENIELLDSQDALTSQIAGLDLQIEQLRGTIDAQEAQLAKSAGDNEALSAEISGLQASLQAAETEALALRGERDSLQLNFDNLADKSRGDVGRLAGDLEASVGELASCRTDFDAFKATAAETANASGDLKCQLALSKAEVDDLRGKIRAMTDVEADLRAQLDGVFGELATAQSVAGQLPDASARLKAAEDMVVSLEAEMDSLRENNSMQFDALSVDLATAKAALSEKDSMIADLKAQLAGLQSDRDADLTGLQDRLASLSEEAAQVPAPMTEVRNRDIQILDLESDLSEMKADADARVAGLRTEVGRLSAELDASQELAMANDGASGQLGIMQAMINKRGSDLDRVQTALDASLSTKADLEAQLRDTQNSLNSTEALLATAEGDIALLTPQADALAAAEAKITDLEADVAAVEVDNKQLKVDITALRSNAQKANFDARETIKGLEADLAAMKDNAMQVGELNAKLNAAEEEITVLRGMLAGAAPSESSFALNSALRRWMETNREGNADSEGLFLSEDKLVLASGASLFQPGSARLSPAGESLLAGMAGELKETINELPEDEDWSLQVLGHADATPSGSRWPSNWELSSFRAATVVRTLVDAGLPAERLSAVGMGEFHPLVDEATPEAYAKNRRIELQFR